MSSPASRRRARLARLVVALSALSLLVTATAAAASPEQARGQDRAEEVRQGEPGAHGQEQAQQAQAEQQNEQPKAEQKPAEQQQAKAAEGQGPPEQTPPAHANERAHDNPSQENKAAAQERREQAQGQQAAAHEARDERAENRAAETPQNDDEANVPSGNKGSVKVRSHGADTHPPRNEPHVDCVFDVLFYGFAATGATASIATHAPTAPVGVAVGSQSIDFEGNPANRPGNEHVGTLTFDLRGVIDTGEFTHHAQQGYHLKLTVVNHDRENGNVKHKVFWVDCAPSAPAGQVETEDTDVQGAVTTSNARISIDAVAAREGGAVAHGEVVAASVDTTEVLGLVVEADDVLGDTGVAQTAGAQPAQVGTAPTTGQLAMTGIGIVAMLALGAALLTGGGGALEIGRRLRRR